MAPEKSQSPDDPNSETSIDNLLKLISRAVVRAYRIYGHPPNRDDMEDLAQSIALSLIKKDGLRSFEHRSSEKTWLQKIANHRVLNFFCRRKATVNVDDLSPGDLAYQPGLVEKILFKELKKSLGEKVGDLAEREHELLELMLQDLSTNEIAKCMEIEPNTVSKSKGRLVNKIRKLLESKGAINGRT